MSFGISVSDIWLGIQACEWLVKQCFDKNSSADERYKQLENDVKHLESRLRSLKLALEEAIQRYEDPEHDAIDLQCDLGSLIGDFQHTLENCKEILVTHVTLKRNRAGWIQNIVWAATAQDKVDTLRRDIQFHSQKIYLVIEPVNLRLLTTIDGKVDELLDLIRTHFRAPVPLPPLPQWLDMRLRETVFDNTPTSFSELSEIPLKEGFDALYTHFRESTYAFRDAETGDQTPEQYLNLLKCQWLLEIIRQGDNFQRARQGSLYRRTIGQLERRIFDQYQRPGIVHFDERQLQNLSGTAFLIWPPEQLIQIRFPTDPDEGEQIILRLSNERENLIIFRSGPTLFRIARRFTDNFGTPYYENDRFNIHSDKFTPFYTIAKNIPASRISRHSLSFESTLRMSITRGNETGAMEYGFMEETDMFNFQRVITGYQVVFDEKKVEWALNPAKGALSPSKKIHMREGRIQIWHWNELVEERAANTAASSPTASVRRRVLNPSTGPDGNSNTESVICATTPPLPVLIIYAQDGEVYTYIHLEHFRIDIVPTSCKCSQYPNECKRIIIEMRNKRDSPIPFKVRKMSVKANCLNDWNLALFGQPRHPMFYDKKVLPRVECNYLALDFATVEDRQKFTKYFKNALRKRNKAENRYRGVLITARYIDEGGRLPNPQARRASTVTSEESISEEPPFLQPISRMSSLNISQQASEISELGSADVR